MIRHSRHTSESWKALPWKKLRRNLFRLQKRVFKAVQVGDKRKARLLQKLILKSTSARFLAIRQVSQRELSGTPKRIEDLEVKVSSLLSDVAELKQAMSQYTCQSSGEDLSHNEYLHQPDNCEALSEPPKTLQNTTFDLTNESVVTSGSTSRSELQITEADVDHFLNSKFKIQNSK